MTSRIRISTGVDPAACSLVGRSVRRAWPKIWRAAEDGDTRNLESTSLSTSTSTEFELTTGKTVHDAPAIAELSKGNHGAIATCRIVSC